MKTLLKAFQPLAVFYTLTLLSWPTPLAAQAEDFTWRTNNGTITILRYIGPGGAVTIPSTITYLPVVTIADYAFNSCLTLTTVTIPDTVTSLGYNSFSGCRNLTNVTLGASVTNIGEAAFYYCFSLRAVIIPSSVTTIRTHAFSWCTNLNSVTISNGLKTIEGSAFDYCTGLTNVTIPNSVTGIGLGAFTRCASLITATIGDGIVTIGGNAFAFCTNLTHITIGSSLTSIENYAFYSCTNLTGLYFKGAAPTLGSGVFTGDDNATVYYLPGTTNWGSTFGGRPTALWRPQIQASDASFGVRTNQFGFNIAWASGMSIAVDACTNLATPDWVPLQTNTLTADTFYFSDPDWADHPRRFYRVRWP
ncbi:MAG TPA: leucine-rich repeat domain-containing protein [Candidatus Paceibacterota bacterium]|nr:leucine-rich repeat domain-containing protein [Verrucomicrobiota bacterium]HSA12588.1 leucine-rich repeat domain-containing protein [Candidatus Paceibacterota bacterium]